MNNALSFDAQLKYLKLAYTVRHHPELTAEAAKRRWSHAEFLRHVIEAETLERQQRALQRRIQSARFPVRKTLDQFHWDWPRQINESQIRHLFELRFIQEHTNAIFCGGVGLGKTHLGTALGYAACQAGHPVLFTTAVDAINGLVAAQVSCVTLFPEDGCGFGHSMVGCDTKRVGRSVVKDSGGTVMRRSRTVCRAVATRQR
jgi:DNA replication protein DnaC